MRLVFYDEHDKPGLLYQGKLYPLAQEIIALNGRRYHFSEQDEIAMLKFGNFHYLGYSVFFPALRFEGTDEEDIGKVWGEAPIGGSEVDVGFHDILDTALTGKRSWPNLFPERGRPSDDHILHGGHCSARNDAQSLFPPPAGRKLE